MRAEAVVVGIFPVPKGPGTQIKGFRAQIPLILQYLGPNNLLVGSLDPQGVRLRHLSSKESFFKRVKDVFSRS